MADIVLKVIPKLVHDRATLLHLHEVNAIISNQSSRLSMGSQF